MQPTANLHSDQAYEMEIHARQVLIQTQKTLLLDIKAIKKNIDRKIKGE